MSEIVNLSLRRFLQGTLADGVVLGMRVGGVNAAFASSGLPRATSADGVFASNVYLAVSPSGEIVLGYRTFRGKSGALILKIHLDQELAQSLIARRLPNGRALLQSALRAATARFCTESRTTSDRAILISLSRNLKRPSRERDTQ
jgi:hypothetical protein